MGIKRVRPPRQSDRPPVDDRYVYVPRGADVLDVDDFAAGYAPFEFPCHPRMLAGLQLDATIDHQVWEQTCPQCGRNWRYTRGEGAVRWEPIDQMLDVDSEPTKGVDAWEVLIDRYRAARDR